MKKNNTIFPSIYQGQPSFLNRIQLSPEGGDSGGGDGGDGGIEFTPEQEEVIQQRITAELDKNKPTLQTATKFLQNSGAKVFLGDKDFQESVQSALNEVNQGHIDNPNDLHKSVLNFKRGLIGEVLSPVDQTIKELTGIEKEENEKTRDYAKRALAAVRKDGAIDEGEYNAIKGKLDSANNQYKELENKYQSLQQEVLNSEKNSLINKGFPKNLDYAENELAFMKPGIIAQFEQAYETKKDEKGWVVINKQTGEPELTQEGTRKSVNGVVSEFVSKMEGLKFKNEGSGNNGAGTPGDGQQGNMSAEQKQQAEDTWKKQLAEKNLIGHEREAFRMRKDLGLSIPAQAAERWPELKS